MGEARRAGAGVRQPVSRHELPQSGSHLPWRGDEEVPAGRPQSRRSRHLDRIRQSRRRRPAEVPGRHEDRPRVGACGAAEPRLRLRATTSPVRSADHDAMASAGAARALRRRQTEGAHRMNDQLAAVLEPGEPQRIASGLTFTEGPLWHPDGYFYFVDLRVSRLMRIVPGKAPEVVRENTGE